MGVTDRKVSTSEWVKILLLTLTMSIIAQIPVIINSLYQGVGDVLTELLKNTLFIVLFALGAVGANFSRYKYIIFLRETAQLLKTEEKVSTQLLKSHRRGLIKDVVFDLIFLPMVFVLLMVILSPGGNIVSLILLGIFVGLAYGLGNSPRLYMNFLQKLVSPYLNEKELEIIENFSVKWYYVFFFILPMMLVIYWR